jgi:hypothetical protein
MQVRKAFVMKRKAACRDHHKWGLRGPGFIGSVPPQAVPQIPVICDKIAHNGAIE